MAGRRPGDKPLSQPMMVRLLTHICITRPQWVKNSQIIDCHLWQLDWCGFRECFFFMTQFDNVMRMHKHWFCFSHIQGLTYHKIFTCPTSKLMHFFKINYTCSLEENFAKSTHQSGSFYLPLDFEWWDIWNTTYLYVWRLALCLHICKILSRYSVFPS